MAEVSGGGLHNEHYVDASDEDASDDDVEDMMGKNTDSKMFTATVVDNVYSF